jgi:N-glycosylase/DNA lyase
LVWNIDIGERIIVRSPSVEGPNFYISSISLVILLALVPSLFFTQSLNKEYSHKINQLSSSILSEKKRFLRNTVERTIYYIEQERKRIREENATTNLTTEQIEALYVDSISRYIKKMRLVDNGNISG